MDTKRLRETVALICQDGRGILAADESTGTIKKRLDSINVESTEDNRRGYRNTLFTAEGLEKSISGVILFDETVDQMSTAGQNFSELLTSKGIVPGIKVDTGKADHPNCAPQTLTHGLDDLPERLANFTARTGGLLRFTKWRQVILIEPEPTDDFLAESMDVMAQYALSAQEAGYVPITEPEVLMDGTHTLEQCKDVTIRTLKHLYIKLEEHGVDPALTLLKPNMVLSGKNLKTDTAEEVALHTVEAFQASVPDTVAGIVFLSGGQTSAQASANLSAIANRAKDAGAPWWFSYSYGRALQEHALTAWGGKEENVELAQDMLLWRGSCNSAAQQGMYEEAMEEAAAIAA